MKRILIPFISIIFLLAGASFAFATKVYFSPNGGCQEAVIATISKAQETIDIAMYDFTSGPIAQELVKAKKRDVRIRIVLDKGQEQSEYSKKKYLLQKGFSLKYHTGSGLMHNKFAIIDGQMLLTGSFNWTLMAEHKNEENLLIITDQQVVSAYKKRFKYLYENSHTASSKTHYNVNQHFQSHPKFF